MVRELSREPAMFLLFEEFLAFLTVFPFFSKGFRGWEEMEILAFGGSLPFPRKGKEKKIRVEIDRNSRRICICTERLSANTPQMCLCDGT